MTVSLDRDLQLTAPDVGVIDYEHNDATRSYFRVRECELFYRSLKHACPRRDFHSTLREVCEEFLAATMTKENRRVVDALMVAQHNIPGQATLEDARKLFPRAYELLGLGAPLTFDSLRSSYRDAVKRHHPDRGGSHGDMVSINLAKLAIEALLCREIESRNLSDGGPPDEERPSCAAYRWEIVSILVRALVDDWSLAD